MGQRNNSRDGVFAIQTKIKAGYFLKERVKVSRIYIAFIESMAAAVFIVPLWCI